MLNKLAKRIVELRKQNNLTQEKLAEKSGVSYKHIQKLEGKYNHDPKLDTLNKIAKAFKIPLFQLLKF